MARLLLVLLLAIGLSNAAYAEDLEFENEGDCEIYRSIASKTFQSLEQAKDAELHYSELFKVRRAELAQCAEIRGIDLDGTEEAEQMAAQVCRQMYQNWLQTGYRLRAVRSERESGVHALELLGSNLERFCGRSAEIVPVSARVR